MVGLIGGTAEWVFAFEDRMSVTVSAADHLMDIDTDALTLLLWRDVAVVHDLTGPVPPCRIVKEKRATFAATPAEDARRPPARTEWANLFLAGDWTDTGLPATIEGALRSGNRRGRAGAGRRLIDVDRHGRHRGSLDRLEDDIDRAAQALMRRQRADGHWVFELEADATIPSEYVLLRHYLGEPDDPELERKIAAYLRRIQGDHGGWPLFHGGAFDISASVKAYFCLKMIGDSPDAPHMAKARNAILAHGGAGQANVFTRILLAQFGQLSWAHVPTMPVEIILLPRWFPIHLSRMSYWARTVIVPLLVLAALRRRARNPRGIAIQELFAKATRSPPGRLRMRTAAGRCSSTRSTRC